VVFAVQALRGRWTDDWSQSLGSVDDGQMADDLRRRCGSMADALTQRHGLGFHHHIRHSTEVDAAAASGHQQTPGYHLSTADVFPPLRQQHPQLQDKLTWALAQTDCNDT